MAQFSVADFAPFSDEADTIQLVGQEPQSLKSGLAAQILSADNDDLLGGNDSIIAAGEFFAGGLIVLPPPDLEVMPTSITALYLEGALLLGRGNDVVLGAVQLTILPFAEAPGVVTGIDGNSQILDLGQGNDIVAGLALGDNARAVGMVSTEVATGTGNDIVVGVAGSAGAPAFESLPGTAFARGLDDVSVTSDGGANVVVGVGIASGFDDAALNASGIIFGSIDFSEGTGSDVVLGIALGLTLLDEDEQGPDLDVQPKMSGNFGILANDLSTGGGADLVAGVVAYQSAYSTGFSNNLGVSSSSAQTGDGADIVVGVVAVLVEEGGGNMNSNVGIQGSFDTGAQNDQLIGVVYGVFGDTVNVDFNIGINGSVGGGIDTGTGEDLILGIADVVAPSIGWSSSNVGITVSVINMGADDDIIVGLSLISAGDPGSGDSNDGYGITSSDFIEDDRADGDSVYGGLIDLGSGDDFVYARGLTGGIDDVEIRGQAGNDVFDIHSGFGAINGGDDIDTLVLSGEQADYDVQLTGSIGSDAEQTDGVLFLKREGTDLFVSGVERFVFDDGVYTYEELSALAIA